jgi:hypothetical protein
VGVWAFDLITRCPFSSYAYPVLRSFHQRRLCFSLINYLINNLGAFAYGSKQYFWWKNNFPPQFY